MFEFLSLIWGAISGIPWWFWLFGLIVLLQKPITKGIKRFFGKGVMR